MEFSSIRLKQIRESLGFNKAEAGRILHMTAMGYGRYESGERIPSYQTVRHMAQVFGTSPDYLYGLSDCPAPDELVISSAADPELFMIVKKMKSLGSDARNRLLAYFTELEGPGAARDYANAPAEYYPAKDTAQYNPPTAPAQYNPPAAPAESQQ